MWLEVIIFLVFLAVLDYYRKKQVDMKTNISGRSLFPFFGNALQYRNHSPESLVEAAKIELANCGGIYRVWVFHKLEIIISDPVIIEHVLNNTKHITKNGMYDLLHPWLNTGLLLSTGPKWFARRKIITPTFHFSILEQFIQIFDEQSTILIEKLRPHAENGKVFDMYSYIALVALDVVSESALGIKLNAQTDPECAYVKAIHGISEIVTHRFLNAYLRPPLLFFILSYRMKKRHDELLETLHTFTEQIIEERRELLKQKLSFSENTKVEDEDNIGKKKRMAFLDVLLQATINGKPLSNKDIREEVDTFTFEGHDTTASGMGFTLFCISRHPEIQEKVFQEIREIFEDDKKKPATYRDLQQLKYTELVIKESLRMYPPVAFFGRALEEDLNINGKHLPAGSSINIAPILSMKCDKNFPDPFKFIPERHAVESSADDLNPFSYIPFSAGPRNCVGQKFAMFEMKSVISKILRHYELLPIGENVKPYVSLILRSRNGFQMGLRPRVY